MTLRLRDRIGGGRGHTVVEVAFTDRALDVGDRADPQVRARSLTAVAEATGATPVLMRQVHGADVAVVEEAGATPEADALVTTRPGLALLSRAADCVPVLLADPVGVVAAAHSGRGGLATGIVPATVARMRELGAGEITAWVGPHICGACYEVPAAMRDEVGTLVPESSAETSWGTPSIDLGAGVRAQLVASGVAEVRVVGGCTRESADLPSYRRDGDAATRFAGVVWMVGP